MLPNDFEAARAMLKIIEQRIIDKEYKPNLDQMIAKAQVHALLAIAAGLHSGIRG